MLNFNTTICADSTRETGSFVNKEKFKFLQLMKHYDALEMSFHTIHPAKRTHTLQVKWGVGVRLEHTNVDILLVI